MTIFYDLQLKEPVVDVPVHELNNIIVIPRSMVFITSIESRPVEYN